MPRAFGRHARLLWTPGSGGESFRASSTRLLDCIAVEDDWSLGMVDVTPLGQSDQVFASMSRTGRVVLRFDVRPESVPQIPSHVAGTLRVYDSLHFARYREGSVILERMSWRARHQAGEAQHLWYVGRWTGEQVDAAESAPALVSATWDPVTAGLALTFSREIARGSAALLNGIRFINASGARITAEVEPTIAGTGATIPIGGGFNFTVEAGPFSPVSTIDIAAGFFKSSDFPSDPDMAQAAINDAALT